MTTIKFRRDTSANWTSVNPIPAQGEPCYETDTGKLKIGNGSDNYVTLPYVSDGGAANLPIASTTTLGAIKVGDNLTITADGTLSATGGSAGTTDYTQLENKPQINSVELTGNKTLNDLGIQPKGNYQPAGNYAAKIHTHTKADITDFPTIPSKTSQLTNDSGFITSVPVASSTVSGTVKVGSGLSINNGVLSADAQKIDVDSALSSTSVNPVQNKVINNALAGKQDTISDLATIRSNASKGATAVQPDDLAMVATSGSYADLTNKPTIPTVNNATITIQKNGTKVDSFTANQASAKTINITVPTTAADVSALPASTKYGYAFDLSIDPDTYVVSLTMKDQNGTAIGTTQTIDLPLESVVVNGSYDKTNKKIVLTLQSGSTVDVPVGDLIAGLQTQITSTNKLSADLLADGTTNKVVTATEKNTWNGKQAAISDLATIRNNASAGKTASDTIATYGDIVTHDASEFQASGSYAAETHTHKKADITDFPTIPSKTSQLTNDSGFLTEAPTNMVTTDTNQTISGDKTFTRGITTTDIYPAGEITFTRNSQYRYINNIDTISGGYHNQNGYITFKGDTTLVGDNKLILDGRSGGLKLTAESSSSITCENDLIAPNIRTTANGTIKLTHPTNVASGLITLDNNYGQLSISSSLEGNNNLLGVTRGTAYALVNGDNITTRDKDGNLYHYINSKNITNCLLEVPQRIKLELNNGTLTLKAGSQVIVPNGFEADGTTPKFDVVTVPTDINYTKGFNDTRMLFVQGSNHSEIDGFQAVECYSGNTAPTGSTYMYWYDTANNIIKRTFDGGSTWGPNNFSFPICIITGGSGVVTSIDQVFSGMGYIGSTIWVDKGVKGLIPNGRNEDGSLRNVEFTTQNILLRNNTEKGSYYLVIVDGGTRVSIGHEQDWVFDEKSNRILNNGGIRDNIGFYGDMTLNTGGVITSFQPKLPFRAVDYNDVSNTPHIIDTYVNGTSGYRIWSDGYCEQWGRANYPQVPANKSKSTTITFLKKFANVNYCVSHNIITDGGSTTGLRNNWIEPQVETLRFGWYSTTSTNAGGVFGWRACGYLASGQY